MVAVEPTAPSDRSWVRPLSRFLTAVLIALIDAYRRLISPMLGPHCRFHPTCSRYAVEALRRYGPLGGARRAATRLLRCHPWSDGGYDPVP